MAGIVITGVAGFIGSHLARRLLAEGNKVIGVDSLVCGFEENMADFRDDKKFTFLQQDIRDTWVSDLIPHEIDIDVIVHLAARGELYFCRDNPKEAIDVNVNGTLQMLHVAEKCQTKHFIFADTSAEYDNLTNHCYYPSYETMAPNMDSPRGTYSISKMCASQFVRQWSERLNRGATIFRPFNVYGPSLNIERDIPPVIGGFANKMLKGETPIVYGNGEKARDFIYVSDMVDIICKAIYLRYMEGKKDCKTYNAGTGIAYSVNQIYRFVSEEIFGENKDDWIPKEHQPDQPNEAWLTEANIKNAMNDLDWLPVVDIESGIHLTVESMR